MASLRWTAITSGTMVAATLAERRMFAAKTDIYGSAVRIYWTADGTEGGASLFDTTSIPWVEVVAADTTNPQAWTNAAMWGPMLRQEYLSNMQPYAWETRSTGVRWFTTIAQGSPENTGTTDIQGVRGGSSSLVAKRPIIAYAVGVKTL